MHNNGVTKILHPKQCNKEGKINQIYVVYMKVWAKKYKAYFTCVY